MAWAKVGCGSKERKEAANGRRQNDRRDSILDQMNEEPSPRHGHKKKKTKNHKKMFGIEYRYKKGKLPHWLYHKEWAPYYGGRYETAKRRDQAFEQLTKSRDFYEFRKIDY